MDKWYDINNLKKHEKVYYSQSGEDGLLEYVFEQIGTTSKYCVEFGAGIVGTGRTGRSKGTPNCRHLMENGWPGLMLERRREDKDETRKRYNIQLDQITELNINDLFEKYRVPKNVDLVTIDVDGQDYYIWKALKWHPRVLLIEFNPGLGPEESKVMFRDLRHWRHRDNTNYYGASIRALKGLGKRKGYMLIYAIERNLLFVRNDVLSEPLDIPVEMLHPVPKPEEFKVPDSKNRLWAILDKNGKVVKDVGREKNYKWLYDQHGITAAGKRVSRLK